MKTAFLIIDVQQALCTGEWAAFDIGRVVDRINDVLEKARAAEATVVFIQHEENDGPLQYGTDGWQLCNRLDVLPGDIRLRKTTPDSFNRTELQALLELRGIERLVICGLQSEFCVDSTVRGALARGYPIVLLADAHSTVDNGIIPAATISAHHNATLTSIGSFGPRVTATPAAEMDFYSA